MKMFTKFLVFSLSLIILFSGCMKKGKKTEKEIFFLMRGTPAEMDLWNKILDEFKKEHPDIEVKMEHVPYEAYFAKIQTMMAGGIPPDAIFIGTSEIQEFVKLDSVLALDDFIKDDPEFRKEDYYPAAINPYVVNGKLYGLPNDVAIWSIFYNKDVFDKAGVKYPKENWTWNDFLGTCKAVNKVNPDKTHEIYGCLFGNYDLWMWQNEGDWYDDNTNPTKSIFNSKENRETFTFLHDLIYKHEAVPTPSEAQSLGGWFDSFKTGKIAMYMTGHWEIPQLRKIKTIRWGVVELPKGKIKANTSGGSCFCIPKKAGNPEAAFKLIKFITGDKGQTILVQGGFSTPALQTKTITDLFLSAPENNKAFLNAMKHLHNPITIPGGRELANKMNQETDLFWLNKISVDDFLKNVDKILNDFIRKEPETT